MICNSSGPAGVPSKSTSDAVEGVLEFGLQTTFEQLPSSVVERTKVAVLDTLASMVAGATREGVIELAELLADWGGTQQATELVLGRRLPMIYAAHVNATAGRAWELDDVHEQNTCHVNVNTVPAALAVAEARGSCSGRELIAAISVGSEVMCRLAEAPRIGFSETGSAMSYQCAFYGVALTVARLLGLGHAAARNAMGIAHAQVAGNHQGYQDGAMTVSLMQGIAVEGGMRAALMAERGLSGSAAVLEGRFGYYNVYHHGRYDRRAILEEIGTRWLLEEISVKPLYPCCKYTHAPIDAAIAAAAELGVSPDEIAGVRILVTNKEVYNLVCCARERKWNPDSLTDAQFSLPFTVASAIARGHIDLETFSQGGLWDGPTRALLPRIEVDLDLAEQSERRGTFPMPGVVTITARDGRTAQRRIDYVKGHPNNPVRFEDVAQKFRSCARFARPQWRGVESVVDAVRHLERLEDSAQISEKMMERVHG